jgi:hypothetical protein
MEGADWLASTQKLEYDAGTMEINNASRHFRECTEESRLLDSIMVAIKFLRSLTSRVQSIPDRESRKRDEQC